MRKTVFLILVSLVLLNTVVQSTSAYFSDTETSSGNVMTTWVDPSITLLTDGFEGDPWDANWNDNGTTSWARTESQPYSGSYAVMSDKDNNGLLTSDDLDTSAATGIAVSFWFRTKSIETGDVIVQVYNGSTYNAWYDLTDYPTYVNNSWCQFSEEITDPQYFTTNFRIRFDSSALRDKNEHSKIDDVLLKMEP